MKFKYKLPYNKLSIVVTKHKLLLLSFLFFLLFSTWVKVFATPPATPYTAGESLDPNCAPLSSATCTVSIGDAFTTNPLSQFAATTSTQLAGVISNETGSGSLVFGTAPTLSSVTLSGTSSLTISQTTAITGSPTALLVTAGAHTTLSNAEVADVNFNFNRSVQFTGNSTLGTQRAFVVQAPTYTSDTPTKTITDAISVGISGAPMGGINTAITNTHALYIGPGPTANGSTPLNSYGLTVNAQSGATNNYAAQFAGGNVGIGDSSPLSLLTVGASDVFQVNSSGAIAAVQGITNTGAFTTTVGAVSINANANFPTSINAGTNNTLVSIGAGNGTVAIDTTNWDISSAGVGSGFTGFSSTGANTLTGGTLGVNVNANFTTLINTGTSTGAVTIGGGANTVDVNSSVWDITTTGVVTGLTGLTSSGTITLSGLGATGPGDVQVCKTTGNIIKSGATCGVSSIRFKKDVQNLSSNLDVVLGLRPVSFRYNENTEVNNKEDIGLIAEEVNQISSLSGIERTAIINYEDDGTTIRSLNYQKFIPILAGAIAELNLKVTPLNSLDLENQNSLGSLIKKFISDTGNTISDLYAKIIHSDRVETKELCVGSTCIDENELKSLINLKNSLQPGVLDVPKSDEPTGESSIGTDPNPIPVPDIEVPAEPVHGE